MSPDLPKPPCKGSDDDDCRSPPSSDGSRRLVTPLVVTAFVLVFLALASLSIYCFIRRRRRRRRQQSLIAAEAANPGVQGDGPAPEMAGAAIATDVEVGAPGPEDEEVVHHAWHIRTVGLDEKAIESIALTRYRAGAGTLGGAADCSVCLGEFLDGELLRLLPKCGHAFHVPCIGTWLRAHVNCPLCRADVVVLDSAATGGSDPPADDAQQVSSGTDTLNHERPGPAQQRPNDQHELRVQIDRCSRSRSPEPQRRRMQTFRRVASMDSSVVSAGAGLVPEDKRSSTEIQGNGEVPSGSGRLRYLSGGGRRSLLSGHRRTSSSMLPS
ncbi:E3 ubiquitin-protein ligase RING1-like [Triticum dicoccoides]|uniref:E3 ubiquitin-protein ligase RING1-like n=1 Tax=Triticum dicoccoides TaxID=85692 RepID=UPI001891A347|nr:E3 ubiquitin-protein ligase RING1-like [Triticum dicoccoides]